MKSKVIHVHVPLPKWEKTKQLKIIFWFTKRRNKRITNRGRFQRLQIGAIGITSRDSFKDFKSGQKDYKSGQRFQIRTKRCQIGAEITNQGKRDFKTGQGLQIGAQQLSLQVIFKNFSQTSGTTIFQNNSQRPHPATVDICCPQECQELLLKIPLNQWQYKQIKLHSKSYQKQTFSQFTNNNLFFENLDYRLEVNIVLLRVL